MDDEDAIVNLHKRTNIKNIYMQGIVENTRRNDQTMKIGSDRRARM